MDVNTLLAMDDGEFSIFHYYEKYDNIASLEELKFTLKKDNTELEKWIRDPELKDKCIKAYNFVEKFNWFINSSDGTKEPIGLFDERLYPVMQQIRNKFYYPTNSENDLPY